MGFTFLIMHHTNLTLKLRSGIYWAAEQNNAKLMTQNNAGASNDADNISPRSGGSALQLYKESGNKDLTQWISGVRVIMCN